MTSNGEAGVRLTQTLLRDGTYLLMPMSCNVLYLCNAAVQVLVSKHTVCVCYEDIGHEEFSLIR